MTEKVSVPGHQWLSLGEASKLVGVNQITLRLWADKGLVRVFRTAGGHRRFAAGDLSHLVQEQVIPLQQGDLADRAVRVFRRRLKGRKLARPGFNAIDTDSRDHLRVLGRRIAEVAIRYHRERRNRPTLLQEARFIGSNYAAENQKLGNTLSEAVELFLSHRSSFVETVQSTLPADMSRDETRGLVWSIYALSDAALLALIAGYHKTGTVPSPRGGAKLRQLSSD